MHRKALRLFILLAVVSITGMALVQAFWFQKAFDIRREGFTLKVKLSLNSVAARLAAYNNHQVPNGNLVEQLSLNNYRVMINQAVDPQLLPELIKQEFEKQQIVTDFEYAVYTCSDNSLNYRGRVCLENDCVTDKSKTTVLPAMLADQNYFLVHLPDSLHNILAGMQIWLFSTAVLIVVILFFSYALYFILKQKKLSEMQTDFVNNMTHEFQTPISSILLTGNTLLKSNLQNNPDKLNTYANLICKEGERLKRNVELILEKSDVLKQRMHFENVILHQLINEITKKKHELGITSNITLNLNATRNLIFADRLHLYNTIENIIDNSIKYSLKKAEITIETVNKKEFIIVRIKDKGIGISSKDQKNIFNKFYRSTDNLTTNKKGFGLGLYYVKKVVEAHKGKVQLKSSVEKGTTVILTFKLMTRERH